MIRSATPWAALALCLLFAACTDREPAESRVSGPAATGPSDEVYGTLEPFASEAVYFVLTDRFVDGDAGNNHVGQGGSEDRRTFDRPIQLEGERAANIGYLGGDFKGLIDNADYIADMGFTAVWITPIADNPDEAFTGGIRPGEGGFADRGKSGYHGYWGVNFFEVDEHLESDGLAFADLTRRLEAEYGLKLVLDIVCNHGSPAYTMPVDQPGFGELYDADGTLIADHMNLPPAELDANEPLHAMYRREPDLAQLADLDYDNPAVLDYCVSAHSKWLGQGAAALRIDTIRHMPFAFWKAFADEVRGEFPGLFMFGEAFDHDPASISRYTRDENGRISVLDFPGKSAMQSVFAGGAPYSALLDYLHLDSGLYRNPYELMTFYDNHDMPRMDADSNGFIDAHNWLFTSRGIPVVYYGSEIAFNAGAAEHAGNRNYFGEERIAAAGSHPVHAALTRIANLRKRSVALQRGAQVNLDFADDTAAFYRVYRRQGVSETALVLLNKSDRAATVPAAAWFASGTWQDAFSGQAAGEEIEITIDAHGVRVFISEDAVPGMRRTSP